MLKIQIWQAEQALLQFISPFLLRSFAVANLLDLIIKKSNFNYHSSLQINSGTVFVNKYLLAKRHSQGV